MTSASELESEPHRVEACVISCGFLTPEDGTDSLYRNVSKKVTTLCIITQKSTVLRVEACMSNLCTLKEVVHSCKILVNCYQSAWCHITKGIRM